MEETSDKRRHERKNYHFNVVLVGKNDVQRGCRVLNVSQTGMMLMWNSRKGDPEVKGSGLLYPVDTDVGILFIAGKAEKRTISLNARILWAEWNLIGIEFHDPDPELMELLAFEFATQRPYYVLGEREKDAPSPPPPAVESETRSRSGGTLHWVVAAALLGATALLLTLYFTDLNRTGGPDPSRGDGTGAIEDGSKQWRSDIIVPIPESVRAKRRPAAPLVVMVDAPAEGATVSGEVSLHVRTGGDTQPAHVEIHAADTLVARRDVAPFQFRLNSLDYPDGPLELKVVAEGENGNRVSYARTLVVENAPAPVTPRPEEMASTAVNEALEGSAAGSVEIEESNVREAVEDESSEPITPPEVGAPGDQVSQDETTTPQPVPPSEPLASGNAGATPADLPDRAEQATASPSPPPTGDQHLPQPERSGDWYINLMTLSNTQSAERLTAEGREKGFPVVLEPARIRGRDLWRLRIYGFESKQAAREYGAEVQKQLGLDEILVRRRK